ncbi:ALQxL family class IV lanthipeptide [Streptomyces sp. NPDC048669]
MTIDVNELQTLDGEETAELSQCAATCTWTCSWTSLVQQ